MSKQKISSIMQWFFGIIFIITGLGSFGNSLPFAIAALLFGITLLPVIWNQIRKRGLFLNKWLRVVISVALFIICMITVPSSNDAQYVEPIEASTETTVSTVPEEISDETQVTDIQSTETPIPIVTEESTPEPTPITYDMTVHFLDVGQGLSVFVQSDGENLIYDGGNSDYSSFVVAYLKNQGVTTIDYLISSHYDSDHVSGLIGCLNAFEVKNVICSDYVHDSKTYQSFINMVDSKGLTMQHPSVGDEFAFGTGKFIILAPETIDENDSNDNSVAIKLVNGDNSFIFTGDADSSSESAICQSEINLDCDVLVPSHHGSATATSWEFLQETVPEFAIISCGKDNQYGHPHKDTMDKLESMDIQIYRTDIQGTITVASDGTNLDWSQEPCNDYTPGDREDSGTEPQTVVNTPEPTVEPTATPTPSPEPTIEVQEPEQGEMVWLSETGSKYHNKPNCGRMNPDNAWQVSRSKAESMGYEACKKCY
ncbi:MAG: MBL fold metallo-hydrolase [Eubacterium sp.]|nr:MBL fold metallo-hydrolase [Eubacterium sp.]